MKVAFGDLNNFFFDIFILLYLLWCLSSSYLIKKIVGLFFRALRFISKFFIIINLNFKFNSHLMTIQFYFKKVQAFINFNSTKSKK